MMETMITDKIKPYLIKLQQQIVDTLSIIDPMCLINKDNWQNKPNMGRTWTIRDGLVFEKGAVNFSHVHGDNLPNSAKEKLAKIEPSRPFQALGISIIFHPVNPFVPTAHMNLRFFLSQSHNKSNADCWWFGGGYDLTPTYGFIKDCVHWHNTAKTACAPFGSDLYPRLKKQCDDYFFLPHRKEARGIGGIFFDNLNSWPIDRCFEFIKTVGDSFMQAYVPIVSKRKHYFYTKSQKKFQLYRRGRYVEFNLLYDRGTRFGLQSNGRIESILCSMPPKTIWQYNFQPEQGSKEQQLYDVFLPVTNWLESTRCLSS